jgi:nicotinamide-nucleotide amidase
MINASIITIGDELLIGQVIDTNSAWMAQELNKIGIKVSKRIAVGDNSDNIWSALDQESIDSDIIFITGGLGPTADDITKPLLCKYFNGELMLHKETLDHVTNLFENIFKRPLTERNIKQAEVPNTCKVIFNKRGTAPGMWFEKNGKIFVSLPGVPFEMKGLMTDEVIPKIKSLKSLSPILHRTLVTFGIGESMLADMIQDFELALPHQVKLAYLPNHGIVRLRLTASGNDVDQISTILNERFSKLKDLVHEFLIADEDITMQNIVGKLLQQKNKTLATAESCTGGYLSHLITAIPGSSKWFNGAIVAYSNDVKESLLFVNQNTIKENGAVSESVVKEMALGLLKQTQSDYAIAVSGIMGPDGGTAEKPVGTVWVAAVSQEKILTKRFHFRFDRLKNIEVTALNALNLLRIIIKEKE